jgi:hypothetical protein
MTITLNNVKYNIDITGPINGLIDTIHSTIPTIVLCCDLDTRAGLETVCHEAMHALYPTTTEDKISRSARDLARLLWQLGYRRT